MLAMCVMGTVERDSYLPVQLTTHDDGELIAFTRRDPSANTSEIRILPALGGEVRTTIAGASSPAWSADGARMAYPTSMAVTRA